MKKLPVGIQTFARLIKENYVYIDKTALIYQLATEGLYYFLSRPRRFGKSLLVSTLEALFSGRKELFEGLAINALPYEWKQYPVITLSFSDIPYTSSEALEQGIKIALNRIAKSYQITIDSTLTPGLILQELVIQLSNTAPVVLLIDEYDYPILKHVHNTEMANQMREALRSFYDVIKGLDRYLKFVFLTGVSQFSKTSIFSGLNNLEDINISEKYATLLGYTKEEIALYLDKHLVVTAQKLDYSINQLMDEITSWYDGYCFTRAPDIIHMYNPFSVLLCLKNSEFSNYWFESGTPTFLINLLKTKHYPLQDFESIKALDNELKQFDVDNIELKTLMFQTGYITIKSYNPTSRIYTLAYPNKETFDSLGILVIQSMTETSPSHFYDKVIILLNIFKNNELALLFDTLTQLFAVIPYTIQIGEERYYQTIFYIILKMIGANIIVEHATNIGRIDAVLETQNSFFIIEFKINSSSSKALQQIEEMTYYQQYQSQGKKIVLVGITFDTIQRNVSGVKYKEHYEKTTCS